MLAKQQARVVARTLWPKNFIHISNFKTQLSCIYVW